MLGHQPIGAKASTTVAAVTGHLQHGESAGDLVQSDDAGGHQTSAVASGLKHSREERGNPCTGFRRRLTLAGRPGDYRPFDGNGHRRLRRAPGRWRYVTIMLLI
jgi:hypothetical protein